MIEPRNDKELADMIVEVLRDDPERIDLSLHQLGWVPIEDLLRSLNEYGWDGSEGELREAINSHSYGRFDWDGSLVRASSKHTTDQVQYPTEEPPDKLYYKASTNQWSHIREKGLGCRAREYIRMYESEEEMKESRQSLKGHIEIEIWAGAFHRIEPAFCRFKDEWYLDKDVSIDPEYIEKIEEVS